MGRSAGVRYSGSPIAFSFSERHHRKSITVVDVAADGSVGVELRPTPVERPLREVTGRLDELIEGAAADRSGLAGSWLKVTLTDATRPAAPMPRLREVWPHTLVLEFAPRGPATDPVGSAAADLVRLARTLDPVEVCANFVEWVGGSPATDEQRTVLRGAVETAGSVEVGA